MFVEFNLKFLELLLLVLLLFLNRKKQYNEQYWQIILSGQSVLLFFTDTYYGLSKIVLVETNQPMRIMKKLHQSIRYYNDHWVCSCFLNKAVFSLEIFSDFFLLKNNSISKTPENKRLFSHASFLTCLLIRHRTFKPIDNHHS